MDWMDRINSFVFDEYENTKRIAAIKQVLSRQGILSLIIDPFS
jgi:hypothetical protein